ncbi:MAG: RNA polymerase sigma factor [Nitriliruptorales bacterium]
MTAGGGTRPDDVLAATFRAEHGRVLATLIREFGDFDLAEDALADAVVEAAGAWTPDTIPARPAAWLLAVARRKAIDRLRRDRARDRVLPRLIEAPPDDREEEPSAVYDDRLRLVFTCCHPALATEAQVALTLSAVAGLPTAEIARAFLVSESAMARRLTRAKHKIRDAGIPFRIPPDHLLVDRVAGVLGTVYLVFTTGYTAGAGDRLIDRELCEEAIRLGRVLAELLPDEPEVSGLLALMLLQHARVDARVGTDDELVTLEE